MSFEGTKISEFNQCQKSDKTPFIFYADFERLIEKIDGCKTILKSHLQQHQVNIFHQVFQCRQDRHLKAENKQDIYRGKDCIKMFCEFLRAHPMEIIIFLEK